MKRVFRYAIETSVRTRAALIASTMISLLLATPIWAQATGVLPSDAGTVRGYEVETTKVDPRNVTQELVSALADANETADEIRMLFSVRSFHFIRLDRDQMKPIRSALNEHEQGVDELRSAIEMSGIFYNALRDERIALDRVLAARLVPSAGDKTSEKDVTVFVEN